MSWHVDLVKLSDTVARALEAGDPAARADALLAASEDFIGSDAEDHVHLARRRESVEEFEAHVLLEAARAAYEAGRLKAAADIVDRLLDYGRRARVNTSAFETVADQYVTTAPVTTMARRLHSVEYVVALDDNPRWLANLREYVEKATGGMSEAKDFPPEQFKTSGICRMRDADGGHLGVRQPREELSADDESFPYIRRTKATELETVLRDAARAQGCQRAYSSTAMRPLVRPGWYSSRSRRSGATPG